MTDELPAPLVPAEVDLRDFAFMPLDVLRLRDSDLACVDDPELFRAAVLSWCVSWHQTPAGSLPDDDALLARLLGYGRDVKTWRRLRNAGGLRGWLKCSDGRLYHAVVAEKANDAWTGKLYQRWRTESARVKKHNQRHRLEGADAVQMPEFDAWRSLGCPWGQVLPVPGTRDECPERPAQPVPRETASKGQGEGQGQGQGDLEVKTARKRAAPLPCPDGVTDQVWRDWLSLRKAKRAPVTETVIREAEAQARKAGMSFDAFLRVWCRRGSQGLEADWLKPHERGSPKAEGLSKWIKGTSLDPDFRGYDDGVIDAAPALR